MVVDFALYLHALGWSTVAIGGLLAAGGLVGAILSVFVGVASDQFGCKRFILGYEALTAASAVAALFTANGILLSIASIVASFGRGQQGGAGPFGPAEQAWLSRTIPVDQRGMAFSLNSALAFGGLGIGALLGGLPDILRQGLAGSLAFRPIFLLIMLGSVINFPLILGLDETHKSLPKLSNGGGAQRNGQIDSLTRKENLNLAKLATANVTNGLAVGLTGPLMSVWFAQRFGVTPSAIGGLMGASFLATAVANLTTGHLSRRLGVVRSVVWLRLSGVLFLAIIPLMPSFLLASLAYFFRSALSRGSAGARQAVGISLARDARSGLASSLNIVSMRLPASLGPTIAGYFIQEGNLGIPLFLAAGLNWYTL